MSGQPSSSDRNMIQLGLAIAALFGVSVAGGSLLAGEGTEASASDALPWALAGALGGLLLVGIGYFTLRSYEGDDFKHNTPFLLIAALVAMGLGALFGASLTPSPLDKEDVSPLENEAIEERREQSGGFNEDTELGIIDEDGDGQPDVNEDGDIILGYDLNGDGNVDGFLEPCPEGTPLPPPRPGHIALDVECDGKVDQWLEFDPDRVFEGQAPPDFGTPPEITDEEREQRAEDESPSTDVKPLLMWGAIGLVVIALLAALIVWWLQRDQDNEPEPESETEPAVDLSQPIQQTIDTMLADPDPRKAICAAYGSLLDGLARAGVAKRPEEAPEEHMIRCFNEAAIQPEPVRDLVGLFSVARFSTHPITEDHRHAALAALRSAQQSAAATAASRVAAAPPPMVAAGSQTDFEMPTAPPYES